MTRTLDVLLCLGVFVVAALACGDSGPARDASARIACRDFRSAYRDVVAGTLTTQEFRERIKAVNGNARLVDDAVAPGVRAASQRVLAGITSGTTEDTTEAIRALVAACKHPGALGTEW